MEKFTTIGINISRYGLVYILLAIGTFKFTNAEAMGIKPYVENSFLIGWMYHFFDIRNAARIIGITEIIAALAIAARFISPAVTFYGSMLGIIIFLVTLSFLFTTPGAFTHAEGFIVPDGFLIKDLLLLGFCVWSTGEAYTAMQVK